MQIDNQDTAMIQILSEGKDISSIHASRFPPLDSFPIFADKYIVAQHRKRADIIRAAHLDAQSGYKYLNGRRPIRKRDIVLRLCIAMGMDCDDVQTALRCCRFSALDPSDLRDYLIILGIHSNRSLAIIQEWMDIHKLPAIIPMPE